MFCALRSKKISASPKLTKPFLPNANNKLVLKSSSLQPTRLMRPMANNQAPQGVRNYRLYHYTSYGLLALIPAALVFGGGPVFDIPLSLVIPIHSHIGFTKIIQDYARPQPLKTISTLLLNGVTVAAVFALLHFSFYDVGITRAVMSLWHS
eukprot:TRINITY_DN19_c0_g1_i1.p1 TRINITY_DN19_c0_g1~~TRINITY_DN19_c0_g1_i1.p1  ORF type:complete len:177 (+),score=33.88 TRINITY_DN19_c0_g1_i1:79-531(+)